MNTDSQDTGQLQLDIAAEWPVTLSDNPITPSTAQEIDFSPSSGPGALRRDATNFTQQLAALQEDLTKMGKSDSKKKKRFWGQQSPPMSQSDRDSSEEEGEEFEMMKDELSQLEISGDLNRTIKSLLDVDEEVDGKDDESLAARSPRSRVKTALINLYDFSTSTTQQLPSPSSVSKNSGHRITPESSPRNFCSFDDGGLNKKEEDKSKGQRDSTPKARVHEASHVVQPRHLSRPDSMKQADVSSAEEEDEWVSSYEHRVRDEKGGKGQQVACNVVEHKLQEVYASKSCELEKLQKSLEKAVKELRNTKAENEGMIKKLQEENDNLNKMTVTQKRQAAPLFIEIDTELERLRKLAQVRNGVYEPSRAETLEDIRNELRCLSAQFEAIFQARGAASERGRHGHFRHFDSIPESSLNEKAESFQTIDKLSSELEDLKSRLANMMVDTPNGSIDLMSPSISSLISIDPPEANPSQAEGVCPNQALRPTCGSFYKRKIDAYERVFLSMADVGGEGQNAMHKMNATLQTCYSRIETSLNQDQIQNLKVSMAESILLSLEVIDKMDWIVAQVQEIEDRKNRAAAVMWKANAVNSCIRLVQPTMKIVVKSYTPFLFGLLFPEITFELEVCTTSSSWKLERTKSDFKSFHWKLKNQYPSILSFDLPNDETPEVFNAGVIDFLEYLSHVPELVSCREVWAFLTT